MILFLKIAQVLSQEILVLEDFVDLKGLIEVYIFIGLAFTMLLLSYYLYKLLISIDLKVYF